MQEGLDLRFQKAVPVPVYGLDRIRVSYGDMMRLEPNQSPILPVRIMNGLVSLASAALEK